MRMGFKRTRRYLVDAVIMLLQAGVGPRLGLDSPQPPKLDAREANVRAKKGSLGNLLHMLVLESWIIIRT